MKQENKRINLIYGDLSNLGEAVNEIQPSGSLGIITDQNVAEHYLEPCAESLGEFGYKLSYYVIPPGEESKNGEIYLDIMNRMALDELTRTDGIIALGGGVVGDLAGFCAATYLRGIKVYQVPTSLLAMVDSSIGGKTGIDLEAGKNLVGAFHMPSLIYQDQSLLSTLPEEELLNGMAEIIKCSIIAGGDFFDMIKPMAEEGREDDVDIPLDELIRRSIDLKMGIVSRDPMDKGERHLLNLGHTFGHAIEKLSDYEIRHGFAVAMGMALIAEISRIKGWCDSKTRDEIVGILDTWGYNLDIPYSMEDMLEVIRVDKKRKGNTIDLVIPNGIGDCRIKRISVEELFSLF